MKLTIPLRLPVFARPPITWSERVMPGKAAKIMVTERQYEILRALGDAVTAPSRLRRRAAVILAGPLQERGIARNQDGGPGQVRRLVRRRSIGGIFARTRQAKLARRDTPRSMQPSTVHQSRSCSAFSGTHRFGNAWLLMIPSSSGSTNR